MNRLNSDRFLCQSTGRDGGEDGQAVDGFDIFAAADDSAFEVFEHEDDDAADEEAGDKTDERVDRAGWGGRARWLGLSCRRATMRSSLARLSGFRSLR